MAADYARILQIASCSQWLDVVARNCARSGAGPVTADLAALVDVLKREANVRVEIQTLWRTASEQCEFVIFGLRECRLRLWVKGALILDEQVFDWADALKRASELRIEWPRLVE